MPFTDLTRKAAFRLLRTGQLNIQEVARLAGVSRQGIYNNLDLNNIDLEGCRKKYVQQIWREELRRLKETP